MNGNDWQRFYRAKQDGLVDWLKEADRTWLGDALADKSRPDRRGVALHALIWLWRQGSRTEFELDDIRAKLNGDATLIGILAELLAPPTLEQEAEAAEHKAWRREREEEEVREEAQRLEIEAALRRDLLAETDDAFSSVNRNRTLGRLYRWFKENLQIVGPLEHWDEAALKQAFGADIADRAGDALKAFWRAMPPTLWSRKPPAERNLVNWHTTLGLVGVATEASSKSWSTSLSSEDACTAAAHATLALNDLPKYIYDLAASHPRETEEVIGGEVSAELRIGSEYGHLPTLQALTHADAETKRLCAPRLLAELQSWPETFEDETAPRWDDHLDRVLRILTEARTVEDRGKIVEECVDRYRSDPTGALAFTWLRGIFRFDSIQGANALIEQLGETDGSGIGEYAIGAFAALLDFDDSLVIEIEEPEERARILGRLVRDAYAFVRLEDDIFPRRRL